MDRTQLVTELERDAAAEAEEAHHRFARAQALREQARLLRESAEATTDIAATSRFDAIDGVLRQAGSPLSPTEIGQALAAAGRAGGSRQTLTASLDYLRKQQRVVRVGLGSMRPRRERDGTVAGGLSAGADAGSLPRGWP